MRKIETTLQWHEFICDPYSRSATYYRGHLVNDRGRMWRTEVARLAELALHAASTNTVDLVQKRHGPHDYEYIAMKRTTRDAETNRISPSTRRGTTDAENELRNTTEEEMVRSGHVILEV